MALAGRVHTLTYDEWWSPYIAKISFIGHEKDYSKMRSSFRSLKVVYAELNSRDAYIAITRCCIVPTLQALDLNLSWDNFVIPSLPDFSLIHEACSVLHRLQSLSPLLEDLKIVITGRLRGGDNWDKFSSSPSSLPQLIHLRRLEVSHEMLPHIWAAASTLPHLKTLVGVECARPDRSTTHSSNLSIHPFPREGFRSLESLSLRCSWTRALLLFPPSMDTEFVPMLHTLVFVLPKHEAATGWDFQCLLVRMRPLRDQIQHLVFGSTGHLNHAYSSLTGPDLKGLRSFTALRQLSIPTQESFASIYDIVDDLKVLPHMELCTVYQRYTVAGRYRSMTHAMFFDALSCNIIRYHYPDIARNHIRLMERCNHGSPPIYEWRIEPPRIARIQIPYEAATALQGRFPQEIYNLDVLCADNCHFGRQIWRSESDLEPVALSKRNSDPFHFLAC